MLAARCDRRTWKGKVAMKSKRAEFFDNAVVSGPDQKAFEEKVYAEAQAKRWPRVAEGTGTFEGQVAIVTGAAGGQGEMEAKMIAQQAPRCTWPTSKKRA